MVKRINHEQVAATALKTKVNKNRILRTDERVQGAVASELSSNLLIPAEPGSSLAKVQARLLSSKVLANAAITVVQSILRTLHPDTPKAQSPGVANAEEDTEAELLEPAGKLGQLLARSAEEDSDGEQDEDVSSPDLDTKVGSPEFEGFDDGGSEDSGVVQGDTSEGSDDDLSSRVGDDPSRSLAPQITTGTKGESTFLPSLSVGFIRGDSDSDYSDGEAASVVGGRKNRRGQRARRAIWEKKYGKNANHVKKGATQGWSHSGSADTRKRPPFSKGGRRDAESAVKSAPKSYQPRNSDKAPSGASAQPESGSSPNFNPQPRVSKEERPLHPSWEAKRKLKEKQPATIVPPQGKKIKF